MTNLSIQPTDVRVGNNLCHNASGSCDSIDTLAVRVEFVLLTQLDGEYGSKRRIRHNHELCNLEGGLAGSTGIATKDGVRRGGNGSYLRECMREEKRRRSLGRKGVRILRVVLRKILSLTCAPDVREVGSYRRYMLRVCERKGVSFMLCR
jgi:hypothetical protein